jgi:hypothetical protein
VDNREDAAIKIGQDLLSIEQWSQQWLVNFSAKKTKSMIISNKHDAALNPPLLFKSKVIDNVTSEKHLGLIFSRDLKWHRHIDAICLKARKKLNAMLPLKYKLSRETLHTMYLSFVQSSIDYASAVWGGMYDIDYQKLEKIQSDAMRLITGATQKSHTQSLYEDTGFVPVKTRVEGRMLTLMYKILHGLCPSYLRELVNLNIPGRYDLRHQPSIALQFARLDIFQRSFFNHASVLWNKLSAVARNATSLSDFHKILNIKPCKNYLYMYGERWPSVHHARMRIGCSGLKGDLCLNLHVIDSPKCECGFTLENASHYLLHCPFYVLERAAMLSSISDISVVTVESLLYGSNELSFEDNKKVFLAVHNYIISTKRFQ